MLYGLFWDIINEELKQGMKILEDKFLIFINFLQMNIHMVSVILDYLYCFMLLDI